jgi:hypothetical protein
MCLEAKEGEMKRRMLFFTTGVLCSCVCLLFATKSLAQTPAEKLQHLSQVLNLSPEQKSELLPILEHEGPKLEALRNNPNLTPSQKAMQLRAIQQQSDPQIKAILSPQQYQEWQDIRQREIEQAVQRKNAGPN